MGVGKYSPTVSTSYSRDQEWWYKNGGGFGNGKNPDSDLDDDGFDSYGYDNDNIDRAGVSEISYMSTYSVDNEGELHYYLYEEVSMEWAGRDIFSEKTLYSDILNDPAVSNYISQLEEIAEIQKQADILKRSIESKIKLKYPNYKAT